MNLRLALLLFAFCAGGVLSASGAGTRIALVGNADNAGLGRVLDAASVLLSKDADLQLLERSEVNRILQEQQLSLAGRIRAEEAVKAGQILHVDLFAVLEGTLTNGNPASVSLGLVVFDAKTGVRYADTALTGTNAVSAAAALAAAVRAAVVKSHLTSQDLHTVGLLSVRNADLPRQFDSICDSVGLLLERELTGSPGIAVLERRRLEQVTRERSVAPEAEMSGLLASLRMIELDIGQDGPGLRGTLALAGADGTRTNGVTASVSTRDPAALAHLLAGRIEQILNAPRDVTAAERGAEAARFHREYLLMFNHHDYAAAVHALDAALALAPERKDWQLEMVNLLPDAATEFVDPGGQNRGGGFQLHNPQPTPEALRSSLDLGHRGADLLLDLSRQAAGNANPGDPVPEVLKWGYRLKLSRLLKKFADVNTANSAIVAEIASLAGKERILRMDILEPFLRSRAIDQASFATYGSQVNLWLYPSDRSPFPNLLSQRCEDDVLVLSRWVEASHKLNPPDGSGDYQPMANSEFFNDNSGNQIDEFRQALEKDPDPVIRLYAHLGRVTASMKGTSSTDATLAAEREFRRSAQDLLAQGDTAKPGPLREHVWRALNTALGTVINHPEGWKEYLEACRFAFDQKDSQPQLFRSTAFTLNDPRHRKLAEQLEVVNGALKLVLERPAAHPESKPYPQIERDKFIKEFQQISDQLTAELAGTNTTSPLASPWKSSVCLLDVAKPIGGFAWLFKPVVQDGQIYSVMLGIKQWGAPEDSLQLVRVPLAGGPASFLGRSGIAGIDWGLNGPNGISRGPERRFDKGLVADWDWPDVTRAACMGAGYYFAATCSGVYFFPTNGDPVFRLCATNGLPSDDVRAVAFLDGKLYVGTGEPRRAGYLVSYELLTRKITILASNRRSEHLSPLDDGTAFCIHYLMPEPSRHRVLLAVSSYNAPNGKPQQMNSSMGIWTYSPAAAEFKLIGPLNYFTSPFPTWVRTENWAGLVDLHTLAVSGPNMLFDLRNEQARPVFDSSSSPTTGGNFWRTPVNGKTGLTRSVNGPFLMLNGWFYSAMPFERRALADARREEITPIRANYTFEPKERLQLLDDGKHVLAADQYSLWLLELKPEMERNTVSGQGDKGRK